MRTGERLWFVQDLGEVRGIGTLSFVVHGYDVHAVGFTERSYPTDDAAEEADLLGSFGADVEGLGEQLLEEGASFPSELEEWCVARSVPAADLGHWFPTLVSVDGGVELWLARSFGRITTYATTRHDRYWYVFAPTPERIVRLRTTPPDSISKFR